MTRPAGARKPIDFAVALAPAVLACTGWRDLQQEVPEVW